MEVGYPTLGIRKTNKKSGSRCAAQMPHDQFYFCIHKCVPNQQNIPTYLVDEREAIWVLKKMSRNDDEVFFELSN